ncbi:sulfatase [Pseudopedobacter saltans DSM 12145]|uniref:Sulfatase n=1 Tax=Pseudopedobacter saltans (strain ATCC 51119 / DSM 12145 / JCM 21818 / CCUG 39354 / LMG 10337 / NBRC 100064 / NCIMB 13643) TaxID=762903 RepID=F0S8N6_PSESL|nr:sulfatase [Pseudopedobacter saltans]ADY52367.1 sulfatase [Pseudopedobacter saltans DSM 12145]
MNKTTYIRNLCIAAVAFLFACKSEQKQERPNILLLMSDNQSWNHVGIYGDSVVRTPNIDKIAREGVRFTNAYCNSPSCTPARAAMLTGQDIWRIEEGANLWGILPTKYEVLPDLLEKAGYRVGYDGKGWGPGSFEANGRKRNPGGNKYANFAEFIKDRKSGEPWSYWFNSLHPHRPYEVGSGEKAGVDINKIKVPAYLPDTKDIRIDIADYYAAIEEFDQEVGTIMQQLKDAGQLENTIVIVCSDNGWQMPRGLANLYDFGTRVPLIVSWPDKFKTNEVTDELVTLLDLAPTFLTVAQAEVPTYMTGKSLLPIVEAGAENKDSREFVVLGRERHAFVRQEGLGYPGRALRSKDFLYIKNYEPSRWPAGDPPLYGDVDPYMLNYPGPAKFFILKHKDEPIAKQAYQLAFAKRPAEELFDVVNDPDQLHNLAYDPKYKSIKDDLSEKMVKYLKETKDPRETGGKIIWDNTDYFSEIDKTPKPSKEAIKEFGLDTMYNYLK